MVPYLYLGLGGCAYFLPRKVVSAKARLNIRITSQEVKKFVKSTYLPMLSLDMSSALFSRNFSEFFLRAKNQCARRKFFVHQLHEFFEKNREINLPMLSLGIGGGTHFLPRTVPETYGTGSCMSGMLRAWSFRKSCSFCLSKGA